MTYTLTAGDGQQHTGIATVYGAVEIGETRAAIAERHGVNVADAQLQLTPKQEAQR
jgi:hypothetical protein